MELLVYQNPEASRRGSTHSIMGQCIRTCGRPRPEAGAGQISASTRRSAAPDGRGKEPRQGACVLVPFGATTAGTRRPAAGAVASLQCAKSQGREHPRIPPLELDGARHMAIHPSGENPDRSAVFCRAPTMVDRDGLLLMVDDDRFPLRDGEVPVQGPSDFRTLGCYPLTGAVESTATTLPRSSRRCC